ncbi:MAG: DUF1186 domain-containing protein [Reinekea sp.]|jgi:hypothetical protein
MTPSDIIKHLSTIQSPNRFPKVALSEARAQWADVYPLIEQLMHKFINNQKLSEGEERCLSFGIHLIADRKEYSAFSLLVELCNRDDEFDSPLDVLIGDILTEDLWFYFFLLCQGNTQPLMKLIESEKSGEWVKIAAMKCLFALLEAQKIEKSVITSKLSTWYDFLVKHHYSTLADNLVLYSISAQLEEARPVICQLQESHRLEYSQFSEQEVNEWKLKHPLTLLDGQYQTMEMDVMRMASWAGFSISMPSFQTPNEKFKVGRNDPCICGSGKKYKKCCL